MKVEEELVKELKDLLSDNSKTDDFHLDFDTNYSTLGFSIKESADQHKILKLVKNSLLSHKLVYLSHSCEPNKYGRRFTVDFRKRSNFIEKMVYVTIGMFFFCLLLVAIGHRFKK